VRQNGIGPHGGQVCAASGAVAVHSADKDGPISLNLPICRRWLMKSAVMSDVTRLLDAAAAGDRQAAAGLLPLVHDELRKLAAARLAAEAPGEGVTGRREIRENAIFRVLRASPGVVNPL
jgi:hypothetical protein